MKSMRRITGAYLLVIAGMATLSVQTHVTTDELLGILGIHAFRVHVPNDPAYVWSIELLKSASVKPAAERSSGLSRNTKLLALRELPSDEIEFTVPDARGSSKGQLNLCEEGVSCKGQYSICWKKSPTYSADGEQCIIAGDYERDGSTTFPLSGIDPRT
jgi:hypothetical protein